MRELLLAVLLALSAGAVVIGVATISAGAAWISAGVLLAGLSWLLLGEVSE